MVVGAVVVVVVVVVVDTDGALVRFNVLNRLDGAPNRLLEPKPGRRPRESFGSSGA